MRDQKTGRNQEFYVLRSGERRLLETAGVPAVLAALLLPPKVAHYFKLLL